MVITASNPQVELVTSPATATRIVLILEYDGTHYHGFQLQASLPTIQGEIEKALYKLTGERTRVAGASRTDAGVHARGQVVSFRVSSAHSLQTFINGLNYYLPGDIAVKAGRRVRDSFSVRHDAVSREYKYHILNSLTRSPLKGGFSYLVAGHLDIEAMNRACQAIIGAHDFTSFTSGIGVAIKKTVRRVYRAEVKRDGELVVFNMVANSFLPHQVRNTVGALLRVGLGKMTSDEFYSIMETARPGLAGPTAPAGGLCLMQVNYPRPFEEEMFQETETLDFEEGIC
ncbi:MAG: tRNA pseudouridine(38-40) synthase TruA [Chloroflexi bacterium]|nr:tRNA pseudouridine(38-40) synthase TruA [Chloroflexota bacterium]MBI3931320.1 tRNA pseudouridine(38-40) synthase TruA [Chloroflexota bacterium]